MTMFISGDGGIRSYFYFVLHAFLYVWAFLQGACYFHKCKKSYVKKNFFKEKKTNDFIRQFSAYSLTIKRLGEVCMRLGFCRSQIPAACQHGSPLTQQNKRVQPWETKSQSSQPGGNVCFGCRHLNGHCLPFLFLFLKCLDLGTFESCQLVTLHAHKCFSMTWSGLSLMSEEV